MYCNPLSLVIQIFFIDWYFSLFIFKGGGSYGNFIVIEKPSCRQATWLKQMAIFPKGEAWAQLAAHTVKTNAQNNLFPDTILHCSTHER